jgi:hypothetical protein
MLFVDTVDSRNCVILGGLSPIECDPKKGMLVGGMGSSRAPSKGGERV